MLTEFLRICSGSGLLEIAEGMGFVELFVLAESSKRGDALNLCLAALSVFPAKTGPVKRKRSAPTISSSRASSTELIVGRVSSV